MAIRLSWHLPQTVVRPATVDGTGVEWLTWLMIVRWSSRMVGLIQEASMCERRYKAGDSLSSATPNAEPQSRQSSWSRPYGLREAWRRSGTRDSKWWACVFHILFVSGGLTCTEILTQSYKNSRHQRARACLHASSRFGNTVSCCDPRV